tara:strand:- start:144 stop:329 length:186 start_codon:yes stop_codon:yes gene_type:complete
MKSILVSIVAALLVVGCGRVDIVEAARTGNIEAVKQHLADGTDVNTLGFGTVLKENRRSLK